VRIASARLHAATLPVQRSDRGRSGVGEEPDEVESAGESGARVSGDEAAVRIRESALPGAEEKCASAVCHLRAGQPVYEPQNAAARHVGSGRASHGEKRSQNGGTEPDPKDSDAALETAFPEQLKNIIRLRNSAYSESP
jgi:hypothetical protein